MKIKVKVRPSDFNKEKCDLAAACGRIARLIGGK